jgi:hypothetical protein
MPCGRGVSQKELLNLVTVGGRGCWQTANDATPWNFCQSSKIERTCFVTPAETLSLVKGDAVSTSIIDNDSDASSIFVSDDDSSCVFSMDSSQLSSSSVNSYNSKEFEEFNNKFGTRHGNRLVDYAALTSAVEEIAACKCCYKEQIEQEFESFLTFCNARLAETVFHDQGTEVVHNNFNIQKWYTAWSMDRNFQPVPISVTDVNHGLATEHLSPVIDAHYWERGRKATGRIIALWHNRAKKKYAMVQKTKVIYVTTTSTYSFVMHSSLWG